MKILLIEDNPADVRILREMLMSVNISTLLVDPIELVDVTKVADGFDAIRESQFDLILLDLSLPDSIGLNTFRNVYKNNQSLPIIVLSGLDDQAIAVQAVREGAQDYLVKGHVDSNLLIRSMQYAIERKRVQDEKERIQEQLLQSQKMDAMGRLAAGIAHDFNNLMTAIQGFTDVIMMKTENNNPIYRPLKQIRLAALSAASLTRQMLMFSRKHPINFTALDLNLTISDLLKMLQRLVGEEIKISTNLADNLSTIRGDRGTLEQVLMNLAVNSRDAMPSGGELTITTEDVYLSEQEAKQYVNGRLGRFVLMSVSDTGAGIGEDAKKHIFEPFFTTKEAGKGSGLGLSVVYGIVSQHEGWISVSSEVGKGTTFEMFFPSSSQKPEDYTIESLSLDDLQGDGKRILIVEDAEGVREFASMALRENGYEVIAASNVSEAIDQFEKQKSKFDLVISDVVLPDRSGLELIEYIHQHDPSAQVLLSSGYTDQKSQWPVIKAKGYRFLQKPYALSELLKIVKETFK